MFSSLVVAMTLSVGTTEPCSEMPVADESNIVEFVGDFPIPDGATAGLHVNLIDEGALLLRFVGERDGGRLIRLNGSDLSYEWSETALGVAIILEACGLGDSALALMAGESYLEWTGSGFHTARPRDFVAGRGFITHEIDSTALGAPREIYLHVPEGWDGARGDPVIVSGDGLAGSSFARIAETLMHEGRIRPVAFASVRFGEGWIAGAGTDQRSAEYLAPADTAAPARIEAYQRHEAFFFDEFLPYVIDQLGGETGPVYVFGLSASATFALEQGLKRPDLISAVIAGSPPLSARTRELAAGADPALRVHLWCGDFEPVFCAPLAEFAHGTGFRLETRRAAHASALWEEALAASLLELAPPRAD